MRKLFTLLTLLVAIVTGAWADVNTTLINGITLPSLPSGTYTGGTTVSHNGTNNAVVVDANGNSVMQAIAPAYGSPTAANFTWANACDPTDGSWSTTGTTWDSPNNSLFVGSTAYTTSTNAHYVNFARKGNIRNVRTFAYRFTNCAGVSALVKSQGQTDDAAACLAVYEVGANNALTSAGSASSKTNAVDIITVDGLSSSKTYVAYIYGMNGSNGDLYEVAFIASTTDPTITSSPKSVTLAATESGVAVNGSFTITGSNLTAGTYNLTIPSVTGLEVSPTSFTVAANGSVSQVVNLSYSSTENVPASSVNITATVDDVNLSVAVNYSASVDTWELQTISTAKTWDFSKLSGSKEYSGDDLSVEHVYANIAEITYSDDFDETALAFTGQFPFRDNSHKYAQNGTLKFKTSVPGFIIVKFSDTGSSASATAVKRYLVVNGETTDYWASRAKTGDGAYDAQLNVTTNAIAVPAGDVTISGTSALIYTKVEFTPTAEPAEPTTGGDETYLTTTNNMEGWRAFYDAENSYSVDENTKVYVVASNPEGTKVSLTSIEGIPANVPVILHTSSSAESHKMTLTKANVAAYEGTNLLTWETSEVLKKYRLGYGAEGVGFYPYSGTPASGAVILNVANPNPTAKAMTFVFIDPTGISSVSAKKAVSTGKRYNLAGQLVGEGYKGIVIENGKKFNQ